MTTPAPTTVFTVRCPQGHALARVDDLDGRRLLAVRLTLPERGPQSSILSANRTSWAHVGTLDEEAADATNFPATCECGSTVLNAAQIRVDYKATAGERQRTATTDVGTPGVYATLPPHSTRGLVARDD
jgi:hypothetical protein